MSATLREEFIELALLICNSKLHSDSRVEQQMASLLMPFISRRCLILMKRNLKFIEFEKFIFI